MLNTIKKWIVEQVLWVEQNLKGKTGEEKRKAVIERACDCVDIPLVPEFVERPIKRWVFGMIVDMVVEKLNWLSDWAFGDLKPTKKQVEKLAEVADAPMVMLASASKAATFDERLDDLYHQYKVVPPELTPLPPLHPGEGEREPEAVAIVPPIDNFPKSVAFTLLKEGAKNYTGEANGKYVLKNPADLGGPTNMGITRPTLATAYTQGLVKHNNLDVLTKDEARAIYRKNFWDRYGWGELAWPVCLCALDCSVNHGGFAWILQRACNNLGAKLVLDGKYGPKTRAALIELSASRPVELAQEIADERKVYFDKIAAKDQTQKEGNLKGWYNRLRDMADAAGVKSPV